MKKLGLLLLAATTFTTACNSRFRDADVSRTESDIRSQFEQKEFVVEQVSLIRDSDRHMSGFAKVRKPGLLTGKLELTKNCTASMDEGLGKSIWECK
jgi:protein involved in sex pheromone biosynthesis